MVYSWIENGLDRLLPSTCLLCRARGDRPGLDLCPACRDGLPVNRHACVRCALPLAPHLPGSSVCRHCHRRPPSYDRLQAGFRYAPPLDQLIAGLKYAGHLSHGRALGLLLAERIDLSRGRPHLLLPAPLHPARLRERGFNQAAELTRVLAGELGLPWSTAPFVRTRHTAPQAGLDRRARRRNLHRSFHWRAPAVPARLAVVDDVVTTGTTAEEMALTLKRAGSERVEIWALARTPETE